MPVSKNHLQISALEYKQRCELLLEYVQSQAASGVILSDTDYILYYTGFKFIPTERPILFVMNKEGTTGLFVPRLELEHAKSVAHVGRVDYYKEYPDIPHPMVVFSDMLAGMAVERAVLADNDGYPWIFGYRGQSYSEMGFRVSPVRLFVEEQMAVKSEAEINLLRESVKWANLAHMLLQRYTVPGATETAVSQRATNEATLAMMDAIGPIYKSQSGEFGAGAYAGYRGQIGRNAAIPHALANNIMFQEGDVLVTGATAPVWGYVSELERTMFLGKPTDEQKRYFEHMVALQDLAFSLIEPGKKCSDVDQEMRVYYERHELTEYWKHHTGHTIGIRYHEGPFLDMGDNTVIQPGLVFTVEPGLYVPGVGGFRHSDTVVVREEGIEILTYYPRDLESLTILV